MHISVKVFSEIPFVPIKMTLWEDPFKKGKKPILIIQTPDEYSSQRLRLVIEDHMQYITLSDQWKVEIKEQWMIKALQKGHGGLIHEMLL
jgi:hypothetical protein